MTESKYLRFELIEEKPKTKVYAVVSKSDNSRLAIVKWYKNWRCYAFYPESGTIWEDDCLGAVVQFLRDRMEERKK